MSVVEERVPPMLRVANSSRVRKHMDDLKTVEADATLHAVKAADAANALPSTSVVAEKSAQNSRAKPTHNLESIT